MKEARLFAFPKNGTAYTECLYAEAGKAGLEIHQGEWSGRWLWSNAQPGDVFHIHWPSHHYEGSTSGFGRALRLLKFGLFLFFIKARKARVLWTAHNLYPHEGGNSASRHVLARALIVRLANRIFAHGATAQKILEAEFPASRGKIRVVPHGNWVEYHLGNSTKATAREALGIAQGRFVYALVGMCRSYKNLEGLIAAFKALDGEGHLLIAGAFQSDDYRRCIETALATLRPGTWTLVAKFLEKDEVNRYVCAADALVLPYEEILTSGSAFLGLSFGVPVVAPRLGCLVDVVGDDAGVLYDPSDPMALERALLDIRSRRFDPSGIRAQALGFRWQDAATELREYVVESNGSSSS